MPLSDRQERNEYQKNRMRLRRARQRASWRLFVTPEELPPSQLSLDDPVVQRMAGIA